jgi:Holliday junction resolvase-like predicted endonuclease
MSYDKHGRGMIAVNLVHNFLIKQGYQVFSEDQSQGMIDMVAINEDGDMMLIDVKALARRTDGTKINRILRPNQKQLEDALNTKIQLIYADVDTGEINFNRRK